ncbi:hypothetical protein [Streptomyces melanogenes]|uniref:hypothetical protein n=1 Tax=Streptomyces melanogenes TaxID=67326 RepID=UPI00167D9065|nr:hypothetical protein [Streptomyces melanogenes]GGP77954.1 hypothetical protein GCM10010278_65390 [Streptomyces melanogenes]
MAHDLRALWRDLPPTSKAVSKIGLPSGLALLALGLYLDHERWPGEHGFATNVLSSATCLMFAVPFALVVLSRLGEAHTERAEQRAAKKSAEKELAVFNSSLGGLRHVADSLSAHASASFQPDPLSAAQGLQAIANQQRGEMQRLQDNWRFLYKTVYPRLRDNGMSLTTDWPLADVDKIVASAVKAHQSILTFPLYTNRANSDSPDAIDPMRAAGAWRDDLESLLGIAPLAVQGPTTPPQ